MKDRYWWMMVIVGVLVAGVGFGQLGYDTGFEDGKILGQIEGFKKAELLYQAPPDIPRYLELEGPTWEETLGDILGEIDTANITIHIEDEETKADLHIFWSK